MTSGLTRREVIQTVVGLGAATGVPVHADDEPRPRTDRDFVVAAGMTEAEADCWTLAAETAGAFFELPELHPMDVQEVANAIHLIQNKLLSRPTYRRYLELAKEAAGERREKADELPAPRPSDSVNP